MWQQKITYITLIKSDRGLGFSLIDYQHNQFTALSKTMIVIRALVPTGVAQLDGRLMPGQRLVSINNESLDEDLKIRMMDPKIIIDNGNLKNVNNTNNKSLDLLKYTVMIIKSLPCNVAVRLGVQRPLPYPEAMQPMRTVADEAKRAKSQHVRRNKLIDENIQQGGINNNLASTRYLNFCYVCI